MKRIMVFGLVVAAVWSAETFWLTSRQPEISSALAVQQLNGSNALATELRRFETMRDAAQVLASVVTLLAGWLCFRPWLTRALGSFIAFVARSRFARRWSGVGLLALSAVVFGTGCIKPYDKPEFVEVDTSETGFLIPLEGDSTQQSRFQSEDYLKQRKVATKRVQITHRWSQEGRITSEGRWIPLVRLVKVNRSPVTREWTTEQTPAENSRVHRADKAIWIESADSVGFSMGFTCTAFIPEEDAAKFLYWYPSGSLADVMDREVRARVQQAAGEVAAKYALDLLRSRKQEIADAVKNDVTNFFANRGVMITTVGMFGGMTYENPEIQKSIDQTFIAQQLKVVSEAKFEAQKKENERIELEANATAERARREAQGLADARKTSAMGEAEAIREINRAALEAQENPLFLQLKSLEVEKSRVEKWDGRYPQWWFGAHAEGGPNVMFQLPMPVASQR